jgi:YVTN family beta-propeller protein
MHIARFALIAVVAVCCMGAAYASPPVQATLTLGNNTAGIASDLALARTYITNYDSGTVSVIDMHALTLIATIPAGSNPRRIVADSATHQVYVTNDTAPGKVTVINGATNAVVTTIAVGNNPKSIAANLLLGEIYVNNNTSNTVSVIATSTNAVIATIAVGKGPQPPTSFDLVHKCYVPNFTDGTVSVIDELTHAVIKTVTVGGGPIFGAIDGVHGKVYVNNSTDKTVSVISTSTDSVIATVPSGVGGTSTLANFATISNVYHRAYLPNAGDGTLTIINTDTDTVSHTVTVGSTPEDSIVDVNGGNVYVVNQGSNSVSILNAGSETVIDSLTVGTAPWRLLDGLNHLFVLNTNGANVDSVTIAAEEDTLAGTAIATEYYEAGFNHYFHTADDVETRLLDDGVFADNWHRTFGFFRVWTTPGAGRVPVCRFFSTAFGALSSHFYTPYASECTQLQSNPSLSSVWQLESTAVYYLALTDANGNCPSNTSPLYRVYNNGMGGAPNHRYTADAAVRAQMLQAGWLAEGSGTDTVFACTPTLRNG